MVAIWSVPVAYNLTEYMCSSSVCTLLAFEYHNATSFTEDEPWSTFIEGATAHSWFFVLFAGHGLEPETAVEIQWIVDVFCCACYDNVSFVVPYPLEPLQNCRQPSRTRCTYRKAWSIELILHVQGGTGDVCEDLEHWQTVHSLVVVFSWLFDVLEELRVARSHVSYAETHSGLVSPLEIEFAAFKSFMGRCMEEVVHAVVCVLIHEIKITGTFHFFWSKSFTRARLYGLSFFSTGSLR